MLIKGVSVEKVDEDSNFVLKRVTTNEDIFLGRQIPITNSLFGCELARKSHNLSLLKSSIQTFHIHADRFARFWVYNGMDKALQHAKENNRFFIPYQQRNIPQLASLDWSMAENDFVELLNKGLPIIPYVIPETATLQEWNKRYADIKDKLRGTQEIMPVLSSNHNVLNFRIIAGNLIGNFNFVGTHFMSPDTHANVWANLMDLWEINSQIKPSEKTSLIIGFNNQKHYGKLKVSGSFASARFGIDVPSQRQMNHAQIKGMMKAKEESQEEEDNFIYDDIEGGFNKSDEQIAWYGQNKTLKLLSDISLAERLEEYQAIMWSNFNGQQRDFEKLNQAILQKNEIQQLINSKSRWFDYLQDTSAEETS